MPAPVLHQPVLDALGQAIADGRLGAGQVMRVEDIMARTGVSRAVVREALRILESLGMVSVKRRVGNVVQPRHAWQVWDQHVIRWRLNGPQQADELDQLMQLRSGLEPIAARLTAGAAVPGVGERLVELADRMRQLGLADRGASADFLAADVEFHGLVFGSSGNDHLAAMAGVFGVVLTERNRLGFLADRPDDRSMRLHCEIAAAIAGGELDVAEARARALVDIVHAEVLSPAAQLSEPVGGVRAG